MAGAGDVNGDGYYDLIAGAAGDDNNGLTDSGSAKVFSLGLTGTPPKMRTTGRACLGSNGNLPRIDRRGRMAIGETMTAEWMEKAGAEGKAIVDAFKAMQ